MENKIYEDARERWQQLCLECFDAFKASKKLGVWNSTNLTVTEIASVYSEELTVVSLQGSINHGTDDDPDYEDRTMQADFRVGVGVSDPFPVSSEFDARQTLNWYICTALNAAVREGKSRAREADPEDDAVERAVVRLNDLYRASLKKSLALWRGMCQTEAQSMNL